MISQEELHVWKRNSFILILATEIQDAKFRKEVCSKCTAEMKIKRNCEEIIKYRTFCKKLVETRERNKKLFRLEMIQSLNSPFIKQSHVTREVAEALFDLSDS